MRPLLLLTLCSAVAASLWSQWLPADGAVEADDAARALLAPRSLSRGDALAESSVPGATAASRPTATPTATATAPWPLPTAQVLAAWAVDHGPAAKSVSAAVQTAAPGAAGAQRKPLEAPETSAAEVSPAVPAVPPFPYRWIGRFEDSDGVQVFLAGAQGTFSVRSGETIDGRWKLDRVQERQLQLIWLPTGESIQVLAT